MSFRPHYLQLILVFFIFLLVSLGWERYANYQQVIEFNNQLAERSVKSTVDSIGNFIKLKKRTVKLFTGQEDDLIIKLLQEPGNIKIKNQLEKKVKEIFPLSLNFFISDPLGNIEFTNHKEFIGKRCTEQLSLYVFNEKKTDPVFVHRRKTKNLSHFDILAPIIKNRKEIGIFSITFKLDNLLKRLQHGEVHNHNLILINKNKPNKIELRADPNLFSEYKNFPTESLEKILYSSPIEETMWELVDFPNNEIYYDEYKHTFNHFLVVISVFLIIFGFMLWALNKESIKSDNTRGLLLEVENERRRIAMDMHDQILSELSHISRQAQWPKNNSNLAELKTQLKNNLEHVTNNIRTIINDLHPHFLDNLGLEAAIRDRLENHFNNSDVINWSLDIDEGIESRLNADQRFNLYRIIMEAVNNIQKHANCSHFSIRMSIKNNKLMLEVEDDGIGLDASKVKRGVGLNSIETRSSLLNADISWSKPKNKSGTLLILTMDITT